MGFGQGKALVFHQVGNANRWTSTDASSADNNSFSVFCDKIEALLQVLITDFKMLVVFQSHDFVLDAQQAGWKQLGNSIDFEYMSDFFLL